jgi:hypothetical protein
MSNSTQIQSNEINYTLFRLWLCKMGTFWSTYFGNGYLKYFEILPIKKPSDFVLRAFLFYPK